VGNALGRFGFTVYADDFARGIVSADATAYFVLLAAVCLLVNVLLLDRRHWQPRDQDWPMSVHLTLRALAAIVAAGACIVLASRVHARLDLTAERLYTLSDETAALLAAVPAERPVIVQAFISPSVPTPLVQTQKNLLGMLREIEARSGGRVTVAMQMTEPFSPAARLAQDRFNIAPRSVVDPQTGATTTDLYLGVAVSAGGDEDVVPFFEPSLSPEYELARAIRVVSRARRKRVGIIDTDVKLLGGFDYQRNRPRVAWTVVRELKKQYEVVEVTPADAPTTDVDVLVLVLPSRMTQTDLDVAFEPVRRGVPTLLLLDPLPMFDMRLAPAADLASEIDPFQPSPPARVVFGDIRAALTELGINWVPAQVAWDAYNPHPTLRALPPENVFVSTGNGNAQAVAARDQATSGLNEVFLPFPGYLLPAGDDTTFEPLLQTGPQSGLLSFFDLVQPSPQGLALGGSVTHAPENRSLVLAARVRAKTTNTDENPRPVNVVAVADLDFISDAFFELGASTPDTSFDNATFFLNAVDTLAGDDVFIALRRHRARHRTLDRLDRQVRGFADQRVREEQAAEREAQTALTQAQERMQQRVDQVNQRQDLDALTKQMTVAALVETENRSLTQLAKAIDQTKNAKIRASREAMESAVRGIQQRIRLAALLLPPVPVLLAAAGTWLQRRRRDRDIARLSGRSAAPS
jgi:ABC-2 type transport system permease protein